MGKSFTVWSTLLDTKGSVEVTLSNMQLKNSFLSTFFSKSVDVTELLSKWDSLTQRLSSFQKEMEEDKKRLLTKLSSDAELLSKDCAKLYSRWTALKPKEITEFSEDTAGVICNELKSMKFCLILQQDSMAIGS